MMLGLQGMCQVWAGLCFSVPWHSLLQEEKNQTEDRQTEDIAFQRRKTSRCGPLSAVLYEQLCATIHVHIREKSEVKGPYVLLEVYRSSKVSAGFSQMIESVPIVTSRTKSTLTWLHFCIWL